jgi:pimeloyl-ACP methyl ester carboxylesterase
MNSTEIETLTFEVEGTHIRVDKREGTESRKLIYVPGWSCSRKVWWQIAEGLREYPSATIDLPGQGDSTTDRTDLTMANVGEIVAEVIKRLGWEGATLIGHSSGGAVALEAAAVVDVARLISLDSISNDAYFLPLSDEVVDAVMGGLEADFEGSIRALMEQTFVDDSKPELMAAIAAEMCSNPLPSLLSMERSLLKWDRNESLARVDVPVTILASSMFLTAEAVAALSDRADIVSVDLGGHFFPYEDPAGTAEEIRRVLEGRPPSSPQVPMPQVVGRIATWGHDDATPEHS